MKNILAVLALVGLLIAVPGAALATDGDGSSQADADGMLSPPPAQESGGGEQGDNQGDPDEIGGGFRGSGLPPEVTGAGSPGPWIGPILILVLHVF
jgi:hypothetical protein